MHVRSRVLAEVCTPANATPVPTTTISPAIRPILEKRLIVSYPLASGFPLSSSLRVGENYTRLRSSAVSHDDSSERWLLGLNVANHPVDDDNRTGGRWGQVLGEHWVQSVRNPRTLICQR